MERVPTEKFILYSVAAVGVIALVAIAPGMGKVLKFFGVHKKFPAQNNVTNALSRMKKKGYVVIFKKDGKRFVRLTPEGEKRLAKYRLRGNDPKKPKHWDGKWRLVTFDIPERQRRTRDLVRQELREAGFIRLHNSLWVSPYDAEEFISLLKADQHIGKNLLYVLAERIEYDTPLKSLFGLP